MKSILRILKAAGAVFHPGRTKLAQPCVHGIRSGGGGKPAAWQAKDGIPIEFRFREPGNVDGSDPVRGMVVVCARVQRGKTALAQGFANALEAAQKVNGEQQGAAFRVIGDLQGEIGGQVHGESCAMPARRRNNVSAGSGEPKATGWELVLVWAALLVGAWWAVSLLF